MSGKRDIVSGGGIVRGGPSSEAGTGVEGVRALRRRWPTGVAIVTVTVDGGLRGATVSSLMHLSLEPPLIAVALERDAAFQGFLNKGARFAVSILDRQQEFISERFAGRAPVPDSRFTGVPHHLVGGGLPVIDGSLASCVAEVTDRIETGDHLLIVGQVKHAELFPDTDEPLLVYDARYRGLEIS
jgi:flavin reductase (DIM6/NTAB) family NADH-FMN oxidoreductase RutF